MPSPTDGDRALVAGIPFHGNHFELRLHQGAVVSLRREADAFPTEYINPGHRFGDVLVAARPAGARDWNEADTSALASGAEMRIEPNQACARFALNSGLMIESRWTYETGGLAWRILLENRGEAPLEVGDLGIPLPMNDEYVRDARVTAQERVFCHSFVAGHGSMIYWLRPNSAPPYLLMTPAGDTALEYWHMPMQMEGSEVIPKGYQVFIHSKRQEALIAEKNGSWRQEHTGITLVPGGRKEYGFRLQWVTSRENIRDRLFEEGLFDIQVIPGMTIPNELPVRFSVRHRADCGVVSEHPDATTVKPLGAEGEHQLFEARFGRLGENWLRVVGEGGRSVFLEFFVTEPLETVIRKRAAFLVNTCRHRDESVWWNGLISDWNMESHVLLDPEHLDRIKGWREYMASCDDPGLGKAPFIALKNLEYPVPEEIAAVDDYIEHFLWGGQQMTDEEPFPFGIYGIPNWKRNRESEKPDVGGRLKVARVYDYPHVALLYFTMYRIARRYPHLALRLPAGEYLRRAAGTAIAMFEVPLLVQKKLPPWTARTTGLYNELVYADLIDALRAEGLRERADHLEHHWADKVRFFVCDNPSLFGSEYAFDSTGFESMHALARYALARAGSDRPVRGIGGEEARAFMEKEIAGNIFCRGWLENAYYLYGSDLRATGCRSYTLSYMSQMGGWALLDYALYHAENPFPVLRLAYASSLSSWALVNSGTAGSNYGYWYPGPENDGGAGGGFEPAAFGSTWLDQPHGRGSWYYGCEIDLGFSGGLRCARTVVADDPIFGRVCFGGVLEEHDGTLRISPRDGVNRRFHLVQGGRRVHMILGADAFSAIEISEDLSRIAITLENRSGVAHETELVIRGLPGGPYEIEPAVEPAREDDALRLRIAMRQNARTAVTLTRKTP